MLRRATLTLLLVFVTGCGLPFMGIRYGYDAAAGRPADPTGKGGCDYWDSVNISTHPNLGLVPALILWPVFDPVPALFVASWCEDSTKCSISTSEEARYFKNQSEPQQCVAYDRLLQAQRDEAARQAEQQRQEAVRKLLAESPVQSEQGLKRDLELAARLTPAQQEAIRDAASKVILTADEQTALASVSADQWHALSQLVAFFKWLDDETKQAEAQAKAQQELVEREEDRDRLAAYQYLTAQAASRQAGAAEWQAAAAWRQQRCLSNLSQGLSCY